MQQNDASHPLLSPASAAPVAEPAAVVSAAEGHMRPTLFQSRSGNNTSSSNDGYVGDSSPANYELTCGPWTLQLRHSSDSVAASNGNDAHHGTPHYSWKFFYNANNPATIITTTTTSSIQHQPIPLSCMWSIESNTLLQVTYRRRCHAIPSYTNSIWHRSFNPWYLHSDKRSAGTTASSSSSTRTEEAEQEQHKQLTCQCALNTASSWSRSGGLHAREVYTVLDVIQVHYLSCEDMRHFMGVNNMDILSSSTSTQPPQQQQQQQWKGMQVVLKRHARHEDTCPLSLKYHGTQRPHEEEGILKVHDYNTIIVTFALPFYPQHNQQQQQQQQQQQNNLPTNENVGTATATATTDYYNNTTANTTIRPPPLLWKVDYPHDTDLAIDSITVFDGKLNTTTVHPSNIETEEKCCATATNNCRTYSKKNKMTNCESTSCNTLPTTLRSSMSQTKLQQKPPTHIYINGWQSWSFTGSVPAGMAQPTSAMPDFLSKAFNYGGDVAPSIMAAKESTSALSSWTTWCCCQKALLLKLLAVSRTKSSIGSKSGNEMEDYGMLPGDGIQVGVEPIPDNNGISNFDKESIIIRTTRNANPGQIKNHFRHGITHPPKWMYRSDFFTCLTRNVRPLSITSPPSLSSFSCCCSNYNADDDDDDENFCGCGTTTNNNYMACNKDDCLILDSNYEMAITLGWLTQHEQFGVIAADESLTRLAMYCSCDGMLSSSSPSAISPNANASVFHDCGNQMNVNDDDGDDGNDSNSSTKGIPLLRRSRGGGVSPLSRNKKESGVTNKNNKVRVISTDWAWCQIQWKDESRHIPLDKQNDCRDTDIDNSTSTTPSDISGTNSSRSTHNVITTRRNTRSESYFERDEDAMTDFLNAVSRCNCARHHLRHPLSVGWCSWYHYYENIDADTLRQNFERLSTFKNRVDFNVAVTDDGYITAWGDWDSLKPGKFDVARGGMKAVADEIRRRGMKPGVWIAPFSCDKHSRVAKEHPEWIIRNNSGRIANSANCGKFFYGLDASNPQVRAHAAEAVRRAVQDWGFEVLKLDFLYSACLPGNGKYDLTMSRAKCMDLAMQTVRDAAGDDVFIIGCGCPLASAIGKADGMRVSADTGPTWNPSFPLPWWDNATLPCLRAMLRNSITRVSMSHRWWHNDPDCLLLGDSTDLSEEEVVSSATVIAMTGGMLLLSDDIPALSQQRFDVATKIYPVTGATAIPLDLHSSYEALPSLMRMWFSEHEINSGGVMNFNEVAPPATCSRNFVKVASGLDTWSTISLSNWLNTEAVVQAPLAALLPPKRYTLDDGDGCSAANSSSFDYGFHVLAFWSSKYMWFPPSDDPSRTLSKRLGQHETEIFHLKAVQKDRPQYVGSDLHFTCGSEVHSFDASTPKEAVLILKSDVRRIGSVILYIPGSDDNSFVNATVNGKIAPVEQIAVLPGSVGDSGNDSMGRVVRIRISINQNRSSSVENGKIIIRF